MDGNLLTAGYGDGSLRLFDVRAPQQPLAILKKHKGRVVKVHLQRGGEDQGKLVSADTKGQYRNIFSFDLVDT